MKKAFLTLLVAVACTVTLHAQAVGDVILDGHYQITSLNPNEVKLLKTNYSQTTYNSVTYDGQTYTITSVGYEAFDGSTPYTLTFNNLKDIDARAFTNLDCYYFYINECPLTEIPKSAFADSKIQHVYIPDGVTTIREWAFYASSYMYEVIGGTISDIGGSAFRLCNALTTIDLSHVESIGEKAFEYCTSLSDVSLPQCLTLVEKDAFSYCYLKTLTMYNTTSRLGEQWHIMADDGVVTMHIVDWSNKNVLSNRTAEYEFPMAINYVYNDAPVTGNYTIPSTVTTLGQGALYHAAGLTGITLPASLTSIGQHAFGKCTTLTSITSNATTAPAVANANAFAEVNKSIPVTIPDNIETYYSYRHATGWKDFTNYQVSLSTVKGEAILELNDAIGSHSEQSIQDMLEGYTARINAASSKAEVESICAEAISALSLAISKLDCIAAVNAAAVGVKAENLQELIDGYVTRINAATTIQAAEKVRDEAKAFFQLMKDKQPMLDELESKKTGVESEVVLGRIQSYIDAIANPSTTLAQAQTIYNQALPVLSDILEGYGEGKTDGYAEGYSEAYSAPTEPGMRLKVTKTDGKVYEFLVTDVESTEYYRATK